MNLNQTFVSNCRIVMFFQIARRNVLDIKRIVTYPSCLSDNSILKKYLADLIISFIDMVELDE